VLHFYREAVAAVAQLDALQSLASLAASPGYCRPQFLDDSEPQQLLLVDGKHPMLDLALDGAAVGNTLQLRWDGVRAAVVTG
jgi:DNA mismatch repair protein MSH3